MVEDPSGSEPNMRTRTVSTGAAATMHCSWSDLKSVGGLCFHLDAFRALPHDLFAILIVNNHVTCTAASVAPARDRVFREMPRTR